MALQDLRPGTLVLIRNSRRDGRKGDKLQQRFIGPYKVAESLGKGTYRLQNAKTGRIVKKVVNACRLKRFRYVQHVSFCEDSPYQFGSPSPFSTKSLAHGVRCL